MGVLPTDVAVEVGLLLLAARLWGDFVDDVSDEEEELFWLDELELKRNLNMKPNKTT